MQRVIDDLIPAAFSNSSHSQDASSMSQTLQSKNLKHNLPEGILNVLNKVYSRRFDFDNQSKKFAKDKHKYE